MQNIYRSDFLNVLQERGFIHQCSDFEGLDNKLSESVQSAYIGYDPTGPSLHVGHLYTIMMLHWFQQCGHKPISLMGGGTALIPDPTLKDKTRPLLTPEDINKNIKSIQSVFSRFLDYDTSRSNHCIMVNNYDWLSGLGYVDFLRDVGMHFTINRMLTFKLSGLKRQLYQDSSTPKGGESAADRIAEPGAEPAWEKSKKLSVEVSNDYVPRDLLKRRKIDTICSTVQNSAAGWLSGVSI